MSLPTPAINPRRLRKLLWSMLEIYSPSGKEQELADHLAAYMKRRGLAVERQEVDEWRENLVVLPPSGEAAAVLVGHIDTVTAFELEDFGPAEEKDGIISGLGAADMKSGCAAMIETMVALKEAQVETPVALALVVGEEEEGDGAERLARDHHFPWAVIGEPTDLKPCLSHHGYLELGLYTEGRRRHASLAGQGCKPVEELLRALLRLTDHLARERPELVYNLRDLHTGGGGFVVPAECEAYVDLHLPPGARVSEVAVEIESLMEREETSQEMCRLALQIETMWAGYELPAKGPLVAALQGAFEQSGLAWETRSFPSHSDANQLWAAGVKPILLGPGRLEEAHSAEESVAFDQVVAAANLYMHTALALAG